MGQRLGAWGVFAERVLPLATGNAEKPFYLVVREVGESGGGAGGSVKGPDAESSGALQMFNEAGVECGGKIGDPGETAADQLRAGFTDEGAHLGVATVVVCAFHIDEARLVQGCGLVELALGGRKTGAIFVAVFLTEQADVNRATANFIQVNIIHPAVGGGQILEKKNVEEPPE